jgi:hypothetical protein
MSAAGDSAPASLADISPFSDHTIRRTRGILARLFKRANPDAAAETLEAAGVRLVVGRPRGRARDGPDNREGGMEGLWGEAECECRAL